MDQEKNTEKFIFDKSKNCYIYNDGVRSGKVNPIDGFYIYYSWVCEKADANLEDFASWKETLGFLSLEKYRSYVEKDDLRMRLLEMGMLIYINKAIKSNSKRIRILGYRQAVKWGYLSVIINGKNGFSSTERYCRFLLKQIRRGYARGVIKKYNLEIYSMMGKFEEFLIGLLAMSREMKEELMLVGTPVSMQGKTNIYKDSKVDWEWLYEEFFTCANEKECRKLFNILHLSVNDYLHSKLEKSSKSTFSFWKKVINKYRNSETNWKKTISSEENVIYKMLKKKLTVFIKKK